MDPLIIALIVAVFTLITLFSGIPIAFGLSFVSVVLLVSFDLDVLCIYDHSRTLPSRRWRRKKFITCIYYNLAQIHTTSYT